MNDESDSALPRMVDRETAFRMAVQHQQAGSNTEAVRIYQQILAADPAYAPAWINLGVALRTLGRIEAGVACLQRGVTLKPGDAAALSNLGNALRAAGRLDEARDSHLAAIELDPSGGSFTYNLGLVLRDLGDLDDAIAQFDAAEGKGYQPAELKWDRALALLLRGDLPRGFAEYEWRWQIPDAKPRDFSGLAWNGERLDGKTLQVYAEQGFGDTIQFVRYLPLLADRAERIVFECQEPLARLFRDSPVCRDVTVVARDVDALPEYDAHVALLSVAHFLKTDMESVPAEIPYLTPPADTSRVMKRGDGLRVGIVWAGKPSHRNDRNRSLPLSALAPLFETAGADFYSLQLGDPADTIAPLGFSALVADLRPGIRDFADSAGLISSLDLMISADTAPAHLAGALGVPVWTLLPFAPDWRWLTNREDTPWYPSMRLFRQTRPRHWDDVVEQLCKALAQRVAQEKQGC
ncbi:MAG: tetratricopeptide repeat protein [Alphaproteobacteria bacterium]|nr:tetratricopeptide repeat protein [Alphaproteobacteria bacterium]